MRKLGEHWTFNTRDLMRASTCRHCTTLSVAAAMQLPQVMERLIPYIEEQKRLEEKNEHKTLPQKYGEAYEVEITEELIANTSTEIVQRPEQDGNYQQTLELMAQGAPVIYQGGLELTEGITTFRGKPDFLVREDWELFFENGKLNAKQLNNKSPRNYRVWDAKYSTHAKPEYALQVAIYVEALDVVGYKAENARHGLILGNRTLIDFSEAEIVPATRLARQELIDAITEIASDGEASVLKALENFTWHCAGNAECLICEYPKLCEKDREVTSDLLLVAGLGKNMRSKLMQADIHTMDQLANQATKKPKGVSQGSFDKLQAQAAMQVRSLITGQPENELLPDPLLQYLPQPSTKDVFFDMEGFPYFPGGGLEYLFGNWTQDEGFVDFWATTREAEKLKFIEFMEWLIDRMDADPNAHVYHYASYEKTALKRLANRHGVMSQEVARLEQEGRLVDLLPFVRKSIRVGEPSYSIKKLERHYGFKRKSDVQNANASIDEYADWRDLVEALAKPGLSAEETADLKARERKTFEDLKLYNEEDVRSTMALYDWLLTKDGAATLTEYKKESEQEEATPTKSELKLRELEAKTAEFFAPIADWEFGHDEKLDWQATAWATIAHAILFYRREDVMFWTDLNIRLQQEDEDFESDKEALLISDVTEINSYEKIWRGITSYNKVYQASYNQDDIYNPEAEDKVVIRFTLPGSRQARNFGEIKSVENGRITFERKAYSPEELDYIPNALIKYDLFLSEGKQRELNNLAEEITSVWGDPTNEPPAGFAALDLLLRRPPRLSHGEITPADPENYLPALIDTAERMDSTVLAVQGPPGSGKTYLASNLIKYLLQSGKSVAVVTTSHSAVETVMRACVSAGVDPGSMFKVRKKNDVKEYDWVTDPDAKVLSAKMAAHPGTLMLGGTAFALCNQHIRAHHFDYLLIDEAAQFSLVDALAVAGIADNLILFGDPQQLSQVVQAVHPGGVENSALGHYMGDWSIIPKNFGYFVEVTRRLHPEVNKAVSWLAYENQLRSHKDTEANVIPGTRPGLHLVEMDHLGNSTYSPEEVEKVLELVDKHAEDLPEEEILIVSPYNAQVNSIRKALDANGYHKVEVGTVDKFQGREGLVVIYSFAASSADDAPRGLGFLLDRNRMNVAISRAKSVCYLVYSKDLLKATFKNLEDLKSVSRLAGLTSSLSA